jgi:hypothetical protein
LAAPNTDFQARWPPRPSLRLHCEAIAGRHQARRSPPSSASIGSCSVTLARTTEQDHRSGCRAGWKQSGRNCASIPQNQSPVTPVARGQAELPGILERRLHRVCGNIIPRHRACGIPKPAPARSLPFQSPDRQSRIRRLPTLSRTSGKTVSISVSVSGRGSSVAADSFNERP